MRHAGCVAPIAVVVDQCEDNGGCSVYAVCLPAGLTRLCTCAEGFVGNGLECRPSSTVVHTTKSPMPPSQMVTAATTTATVTNSLTTAAVTTSKVTPALPDPCEVELSKPACKNKCAMTNLGYKFWAELDGCSSVSLAAIVAKGF